MFVEKIKSATDCENYNFVLHECHLLPLKMAVGVEYLHYDFKSC